MRFRLTAVALLVLAYVLAWSGSLFSADQAASVPASQKAADNASTAATQPATKAAVTVDAVFEAARVDPGPMREARQGGYVDWKRCLVVAEGVGKAKSQNPNDIAMAKRAARLVAARNAATMLQGIQILPGTPVPGVRNGTIEADALLENFQELSTQFDPKTLTARVTLGWQLPADGCQVNAFVHLTRHDEAAVRRLAVKALGDLGDRRAISAVKACQDDPDESVRQAAQVTLRQLQEGR